MNRITAFGAAALSGLFVYLGFAHLVPFLGWVALVPLFVSIDGRSRFLAGRSGARSRFFLVFVAAAIFSVFVFAWMIAGAHRFTGAWLGYGVAIFTVCLLGFSFGCAMLLVWTPFILIAPVWILAETLLQIAAMKMPWFLFHIGNSLATELIAIQPVSVIGVTGVGFIVIVVNQLIARAILWRSWRLALAPLALLAVYLGWGWWLLPAEGQRGALFPVAILKENIPPEIPWDSINGNQRVHELLTAEDSCVATGAWLIVWSESAIPWTYSPDDDLVREVLRHSGCSGSRGITHILGMNTAVAAPGGNAPGIVRNSAYCLLPGGRVAGRYDKMAPLLFIEQPALGWQFPFFSSDGYSVEPGEGDGCLPTPYGKAGVLICNESALPDAAASRVRAGAQFLLNMSNDGWFRDTWLVDQHFYNARLRAVETRRDLVVNSNNGWSGCIHASGRVDTTGIVFSMRAKDEWTVAVRYPLLPLYFSLFSMVFLIIVNRKSKLS